MSVKICTARGSIEIRDDREKRSADFAFRYERAEKQSAFNALLRGPFGVTIGLIDLKNRSGQWTDNNGNKRDFSRDPLMKRWFTNTWWNEMDFIFGIVTPSSSRNIFADNEGIPRLFQKNERRIICDFKSGSPASCRLTEKDLLTRIDFTSVECRDSL